MLENLGKRLLFLDGAMGTQLQSMGLGTAPSESWNLLHPEKVLAVHRSYLAVGCDAITANTFGANRIKCGNDVRPVLISGVKIARKACDEAGHGTVLLDIGPTGKLMKPMGEMSMEEAISIFREMAEIGEIFGADAAFIETMNDPAEMKAAVIGVKEGSNLPILASMTCDRDGRLLTGGSMEAMAVMLDSMGVAALGLNCGLGAEAMLPLVARLRKVTEKPILVKPNAGIPAVRNGQTIYPDDPKRFADAMKKLAEAGAWLLGGCCGTTPEHLRSMIASCQEVHPAPLPQVKGKWIASAVMAVDRTQKPLLIGERINPSGKKDMQEALRHGEDHLLRLEAIRQQEHGAMALDVNVGMPDIDEASWMRQAVEAVQAVSTLPLQIDSANPAALEQGLRHAVGKPMVNSVSGRKDQLEAVLPLIQKYGGCLVGLLMDETGIPSTVEGRMAIARRILDACDAAGISHRDIVLDPLVMAVSADPTAAETALETARRIHRELDAGTMLGISNVSYGLPARPHLNAAFLTSAVLCGAEAMIANVLLPETRDAYICGLTLAGRDAGCRQYVEHFAEHTISAQETAMTLESAVLHGLAEEAGKQAEQCLSAGEDPLKVTEERLIPTLNQVGKAYEQGTMFLPQLMQSAEAAQAAFEVLEKHVKAKGEAQMDRGTLALATVQGDVHDIGKNIVRVLLKSYGFHVLDLGRNVTPEAVLAAVKEHGLHLVGLSALMTTTVPAMAQTVALLHREAPDCRVAVGGAVLTQEMADAMGADAFVADAMATVHYAMQVLEHQ